MTLMEAIARIDASRHNTCSQEQKIRWLSDLDAMVKLRIHDTHEGGDSAPFPGYTEEDLHRQLLIPAPYTDVYLYYLESRMDYAGAEYDRYNNGVLLYQAAWDAYAGAYHRSHMPRGEKWKYK